MAADEKLSDEFNKLEITRSTIVPIKHVDNDLPISLNPFYDTDLKDVINNKRTLGISNGSTVNNLHRLKSTQCRPCHLRRCSDSGLDDLLRTSLSSRSSEPSSGHLNRCTGVFKESFKKTQSRKIVLREPILKAFQTCFHSQRHIRSNLLSPNNHIKLRNSSLINSCEEENNCRSPVRGIGDFRDLIEQCTELLTEQVEFKKGVDELNVDSLNNLSRSSLQHKKTELCLTNSIPQLVKKLGKNSINSKLTHFDTSESVNCSSNVELATCTWYGMAGTSCSQEAGNKAVGSGGPTVNAVAGVNDDVTINELASYFDTLVHIPKKMSTMAEMMYI